MAFQSNVLPVGDNIAVQARIVINNVLTFLTNIKEDPETLKTINFSRPRDLTAAMCNVSLRTVDTIKQECKNGVPSAPRESICKPSPVTALDDFDKSVIKQIVTSFYSAGEYPSAARVLCRAKERIDGFECSVSSMRSILLALGYKFKVAPDGRKQLMERSDIVCARLQFLRKLKSLKDSADVRPRIYLDETWVNQNHSRKRVWVDEDGNGGLNTKIGKGSRLIICHAGCAKYGFLQEAKWVFRAVKSKNDDYHSEMNAEGFTEWFKKLLLGLEEPSIIVMDNASYHSQQINLVPTSSTRKSEIQEWLREHGIEFTSKEFKPELLQKVRRHRPEKTYHLDQMALEYGHEVIRLPPYHCQYNPIELVWAQVKNEVATKNKTFKIADVEKLVDEAISNVSIENWQKCVEHAELLQDEDLRKAHLCEEFIIHVDDDDDDSDEEF